MRHRTGHFCLRCGTVALFALCALLLLARPAAADAYYAACDFNRDGVLDSVVGAPYEAYRPSDPTVRGVPEAGAVDVVYGVAPGSTAIYQQHWTLASAGVPGQVAEGDHFGYAVAWGLFNDGDGYPDLAIGIPGRDVDGVVDAGAVLILHGSPFGLVAEGSAMRAAPRLLRQGDAGVPGTPKHGDNFGFSLAAGDWNPRLYIHHYLAIGAPGVAAGAHGDKGRGEVVVLYTDHDYVNQLWNQVVGEPEPGDWFGYSLAAGKFEGHSETEQCCPTLLRSAALAIGVPGEDVDGAENAGVVEVLYIDYQLEPIRLSWPRAELIRQETFLTTTQSGSWFGLSLATGNLTAVAAEPTFLEEPDELVIGEPLRKVGAASSAGVVHILEGSTTVPGLDYTSAQTIWPSRFILGGRLAGVSSAGDWFGFSVAVSDGFMVVGSPGKHDGDGSVHLIHGTYSGVTAVGAQVIYGAATNGQLGWSVEAGIDRVVAGAPGTADQGGAVKIYTRNAGGTFVAKATLTQDSIFGASEPTEPGDGFGASVGAGGLPWINFKF
jgi:hypothetical protein